MTMQGGNNSNQARPRPQKSGIKDAITGTRVAIAAGFLVLAGSLAANAFLFTNQNSLEDQVARLRTPEGQQEAVLGEVDSLVERVSQHILLPEETPTIATVTDAEALAAEQPFFRDAQNGDRIMIYPEAERAILYNFEEDILVNVGPYIQQGVGEQEGTSTESSAAETNAADEDADEDSDN